VELRLHIGSAGLAARLRLGGNTEHRGEIQVQATLNQDSYNAEGRAAQAERVAVAGGFFADGEYAGQGVEPVGQRKNLAIDRSGQGIAGEARQVLLADCLGDGIRLAVEPRVIPAHRALQVGELTDEPRNKVAFR
jgi:hypothetical protein